MSAVDVPASATCDATPTGARRRVAVTRFRSGSGSQGLGPQNAPHEVQGSRVHISPSRGNLGSDHAARQQAEGSCEQEVFLFMFLTCPPRL